MAAFFEADGNHRFRATELTRGPWDPQAQHGGPPAALLGRALEATGSASGQLVRTTIEILRPVRIGVMEISTEVVRAGRNVELVSADLLADGVAVMRALAWRMRVADIGVDAGTDVPVPRGPDSVEAAPPFPWSDEVGYHTAMEWRFVTGRFLGTGPATVWMRMRAPLIEGEEPSPLARVLVAADSGSGVSGVLPFDRYLFVNTDLTVALHRLPAGEWVCLDAVTTIQRHGIGLAQAQVFDEQGALGRSMQSLFVAPR